jgi:hypothetical protein
MVADWMDCWIPLTRVSWSGGTSWGTKADTAGICTAAPSDLNPWARKSNHSSCRPACHIKARPSVTSAMPESARTIRRRRS